eukprot:TRINITY_DN15985_c0_g1_i1.p1 TRINITY_DN15985_c0_g1~~TRINITY_DN15985_c0_g1_i1.p1  ORF type:complete len:590 (+),score=99.40 TRINITY_DN15985_c0_g1_i1:91-1860(+)
MAAQRTAPGGKSTVCLGTDDSVDAYQKVPAAVVGCGGDGGLAAGERTLRPSSNGYAQGSSQNSGNVITDRPTTAVRCAPGGTSTLCLGTDGLTPGGGLVATQSSTAVRCAPGGKSSVCLGSDAPTTTSEAASASQSISKVLSPQASAGERPRSCIQVSPQIDTLRRAPGGDSTVVLGTEPGADAFARDASCPLPQDDTEIAAAGERRSHIDISERPSTDLRSAPGGPAAVVFGDELSQATFAREANCPNRTAEVELAAAIAEVHANAASQRVSPGGASSLVLAASTSDDVAGISRSSERCQPGGPTSICLGTDASPSISSTVSASRDPFEKNAAKFSAGERTQTVCVTERPSTGERCAPGGAATIILGGESAAEAFDRVANVPNRIATERVEQAVADVHANAADCRVAPGGESTVVLGTFSAADESDNAKNKTDKIVPQVAAGERVQFLTISERPSSEMRSAPGGQTTVVLGDDSAPASFARDGNEPSRVPIETVTAAVAAVHADSAGQRVAPGGASTLSLGASPEDAVGVKVVDLREVATVSGDVVGDEAANAVPTESVLTSPSGAVLTSRAPTERAPPGGKTTLLLG